MLVGLVIIHMVALLLAFLAWQRLSKPRPIRAILTAEGITMRKDGFSYDARWADAGFLTENRAAYLMKFKQLYMRLPKRGFAPGEEGAFRQILAVGLPRSANRLRG